MMSAECFGDRPRILSGKNLSLPHRPVLGKIAFEGVTGRYADEAVLSVCKTLPETVAPHTVGVILLGGAPSAHSLSVPVLGLSRLSKEHEGAIALLDPERATLTLRPDLLTLGAYARRMEEERDAEVGEALPRLSALSLPIASDCDGLLLESSFLDGDGTDFPTDWFSPRPLTLMADYGENLYDTVQKLYLEGVFGRWSLMLRGLLTGGDLRDALAVCHRCFCDLRADGRECNGYLPRGVLIDTPLLMEQMETSEGFDFLCLDYERLCERLGGGSSERIRQEAESRMTRLTDRQKGLQKKLLLRHAPDRPLCRFLLSLGVEEIFLPPCEIPSARSLLYRMIEEKGKKI